jgi:hypothetical protein
MPLERECSSSFILTTLMEGYYWDLFFLSPLPAFELPSARIKRCGKKEDKKREMKKKSHA